MKILKINVIFLLIACLLFAFVSCDVDYDSSRKGNLESSTSNPKSADKSEAIKNLFSPGKKVKVKGGKKLTGLSGGETEIEALIGENILTVEQIETKNTNYVNNTIGFRYLLQNIFTGKKPRFHHC